MTVAGVCRNSSSCWSHNEDSSKYQILNTSIHNNIWIIQSSIIYLFTKHQPLIKAFIFWPTRKIENVYSFDFKTWHFVKKKKKKTFNKRFTITLKVPFIEIRLNRLRGNSNSHKYYFKFSTSWADISTQKFHCVTITNPSIFNLFIAFEPTIINFHKKKKKSSLFLIRKYHDSCPPFREINHPLRILTLLAATPAV